MPQAEPPTGGCNCGAVRYEVTEPLAIASYCHCRRCQRRSGAAASANAHPRAGAFGSSREKRNCVTGSRPTAVRSGSAATAAPRSSAATTAMTIPSAFGWAHSTPIPRYGPPSALSSPMPRPGRQSPTTACPDTPGADTPSHQGEAPLPMDKRRSSTECHEGASLGGHATAPRPPRPFSPSRSITTTPGSLTPRTPPPTPSEGVHFSAGGEG
jgi:hypothetical protein